VLGCLGTSAPSTPTVAEVALREPKPVAALASGSDDMTKLCGHQVRTVPL